MNYAAYICLLIVAFFLVGCAPKPTATEVEEMRQAIAAIGITASERDLAGFKASVYTRRGEDSLTEAIFRCNAEAFALDAALKEKFGEDVWEKMAGNKSGRGLSLKIPPANREWVERLQFEFPDRTTAVTMNPFTDRQLAVIKYDGRWLVDLTHEFERPFEVDKSGDFFRDMSQVYARGTAACRRENVTLDEVAKEAVGDFFGALGIEVKQGE
jgi:hypothetical protein